MAIFEVQLLHLSYLTVRGVKGQLHEIPESSKLFHGAISLSLMIGLDCHTWSILGPWSGLFKGGSGRPDWGPAQVSAGAGCAVMQQPSGTEEPYHRSQRNRERRRSCSAPKI
jgi:hypothetical protein